MNQEISRDMSSSSLSSSSSRHGKGGKQSCAACKYQRRKCGPDCILAPYFPHQHQKKFINAHKLFGVGKLTKMIKDVEPPLRDTTMTTITYQSEMRALDPVGGCYALIQQLQSQIQYLSAELHFTLQQLATLRASSSSSSSLHQQQVQLLNHHSYHHDVFINNNINDINAMILYNSGSSLHAPPAAYSDYHYVDEQQEILPQDVVDTIPEDIHSMNYGALQEEVHNWADSIPMSPLTLEDEKEEQHVHVDHHYQNDDEIPTLDLINDVNSDATRTIHPDH